MSERPGFPVGAVTVIGIDVLAEQRHFAHAIAGKPLDIGDDLCDRARNFCAARIRHHAERAEFVAAFLNGDEGRDAALARRFARSGGKKIEFVFRRKFGVECAAFALGLAQKVRKPVIALRSDNKIDGALAAQNLFALGLRDAARDRDRHPAAGERCFVFHVAQAAEFGINLVHRFFANVTGIEHHQIGVLGAIGLDIALGRQRVRHTMRIVDVHLATVGFYVDFPGSVHATRWAVRRAAPKGPDALRGSYISDIPWFQAGLSAPMGC